MATNLLVTLGYATIANMDSTQDYLDIQRLKSSHDQMALRAEAIRSEINGLRQELSDLEVKLALISKLIDLDSHPSPVLVDVQSENAVLEEASDVGKSEIYSEDYLETEVEAILEASGAPMHISKIRNELVRRGVPIPGRGDDANIIVRLRKGDGRFVRTARGLTPSKMEPAFH